MQQNNRDRLNMDNYPDLQYYAISQGDQQLPPQLPAIQQQQQQQQPQLPPTNQDNIPSPQPRHIHPPPIPLCRNSAIINAHQIQDILPGNIFGDPALGHYHYHIIPSRRSVNCPEPMPRNHSRLDQVHINEHHQHYQRQTQPRNFIRSNSNYDGFHKNRNSNSNYDNNLGRYPTSHHNRDKNEEKIRKNSLPLVELNTDSQSVLSNTKSKCQCHAIQQQQQQLQHQHQHQQQQQQQQQHGLRLKRDNDNLISDINQDRQPPALPPRPPPRPSGRRYEVTPAENNNERRHVNGEGGNTCCKKYVVLCCLCGGLSAAVGSLFLAVHAVLSAHTASLALFETVPSYIPGTMLILIGLFTMLLARRKHRYGFLMKVCGSVSVVCALVCVLVTVTTTVVHMSRLQGLRECVYTARAKSCTCYGAPQSRASDPGVLFEGTPHCEAVHGALYACLRALFGVSVAGILACIFSCMLVYQLLSHEKKKMYWEQLELRCRSLYGQGNGAGLINARPAGTCGCCNDCGGIGPWWAQSPGNLYTPNPDLTPARRWRLPWTRNRGPAPSADTSYGFNHHQSGGTVGPVVPSVAGLHHHPQAGEAAMVRYSILGHPAQPGNAYSVLQAAAHDDVYGQGTGASPYSVLDAGLPLWGPPPPYSDPNSPARRPMIAFPTVDSRNRIVDYGRTTEIKRANGNYENTEQVSNDTDTDTVGNNNNNNSNNINNSNNNNSNANENRTSRSSKSKKSLKGVENAGFQPQEANATPKQPQTESEIYFGDVSSCCGPESSLYDVATEKDGKTESNQSEAGTSNNYPNPNFQKRSSSKRSRRQPQPQSSPDHNSSCSSANGDETAYNRHKAELDYEIIRQRHYNNYGEQSSNQNVSVVSVDANNESRNGGDGAGGSQDNKQEDDGNDYRTKYEEDIRPVNV